MPRPHILPAALCAVALVAAATRSCHGFAVRTNDRCRRRRSSSWATTGTSVEIPTPAETTALHLSKQHGEPGGPTAGEWTHPTRRDAIVSAMAGLGAEAAWRSAVETAALALDDPTAAAASRSTSILPGDTVETIESGRAAVVPGFLSPEECAALRNDVRTCYADGQFRNFILSRNPKKADRAANDRWIMPSFYRSEGRDGPFADPTVGNFAVRQKFKARMAEVKAYLARTMRDRPSLAADLAQTHEMEYLRYGAGALLQRHTDEHHVEIQRLDGARLPKKPHATRRSVTWMVYLNEGWDGDADGGQLRLHERAQPASSRVGARGQDLQVGWLRGTSTEGEQPVFLDPLREGERGETCVLYVLDDDGGGGTTTRTRTRRRDLSSTPFANVALHFGGGDGMARRLMVEDDADARRFHLIDAPKSLVSSVLPASADPAGEDGGERIRDVVPRAGTLVMFDSVSLPHQVMMTRKERFGIQGWWHEQLGYTV